MKQSRYRAAVLFFSRSGNTRLIAEVIAASVDAALVELWPARSEHGGGVLGFLQAALWALS
jgi:menaquinone-dependent protoporphyrinogen IX oxidase